MVQVDVEFWYLIGHVLYNPDLDARQRATDLLKTLYVDKSRKMELRELYATNHDEYIRLRNMSESEYATRLSDRYASIDHKTGA